METGTGMHILEIRAQEAKWLLRFYFIFYRYDNILNYFTIIFFFIIRLRHQLIFNINGLNYRSLI